MLVGKWIIQHSLIEAALRRVTESFYSIEKPALEIGSQFSINRPLTIPFTQIAHEPICYCQIHWVIAPLAAMFQNTRTLDVVNKCIDEVEKALIPYEIPVAVIDEQHNLKVRTWLDVATVYRWLAVYEQSGNDIRSLIPNWHKRRRSNYLHPAVDQIVTAVIDELYLKRERGSVDDVYLEVLLRVEEANTNPSEGKLVAPGRTTVHDRIEQQDVKE